MMKIMGFGGFDTTKNKESIHYMYPDNNLCCYRR